MPSSACKKIIKAHPQSPLRLLPRIVDGNLRAAARRRTPLELAHGPHLPALSSSAKEPVAAIRLESRNAHSVRHLEPLQDLYRSSIDSPQIFFVIFPRPLRSTLFPYTTLFR